MVLYPGTAGLPDLVITNRQAVANYVPDVEAEGLPDMPNIDTNNLRSMRLIMASEIVSITWVNNPDSWEMQFIARSGEILIVEPSTDTMGNRYLEFLPQHLTSVPRTIYDGIRVVNKEMTNAPYGTISCSLWYPFTLI